MSLGQLPVDTAGCGGSGLADLLVGFVSSDSTLRFRAGLGLERGVYRDRHS